MPATTPSGPTMANAMTGRLARTGHWRRTIAANAAAAAAAEPATTVTVPSRAARG